MGWKPYTADIGGVDLTTKGDLHGYDTDQARVPIGTDNQVLTADAAQALGLKWATPGSGGVDLTTKGDLHGYDTDQARVPIGSDDQVLTADAAQALGLKWASPASGTIPRDSWANVLFERPSGESAHADDDEFDADSSADYTAVNPSGSAAWTIDAHVLSGKFLSQSASDMSAYLKALTSPSAPLTIQAAVTSLSFAENWFFQGICLTDGVVAGSNVVSAHFNNGAAAGTILEGRHGTITALSTTPITNAAPPTGLFTRGIYLRLIWTAANTFAIAGSPDGVSWTDFAKGTISKTMTPTHFGVWGSRWGGGSEPGIVSFDYLRRYDSDLSV